MSSVGTMMPILLLLVIILYVFSALGFEMLKYHEYANGENADEESPKPGDGWGEDNWGLVRDSGASVNASANLKNASALDAPQRASATRFLRR
eukprot:s2301_g4.t1